MMSEIINYGDAAGNAGHLHPALDTFKRIETGLKRVVLEAAMLRAGYDRQRVADVEFAYQVEVKLETRDFKFRRRRAVTDIEGLDRVAFPQPEALHRAMRDVEQGCKVRIITVCQQQSTARNQPYEMVETSLDRFEVGKDIGVIELEIIDDRDLGKVM